MSYCVEYFVFDCEYPNDGYDSVSTFATETEALDYVEQLTSLGVDSQTIHVYVDCLAADWRL